MRRKNINISTVLAGQRPGITEVDEGFSLVTVVRDDLGDIDLEQQPLHLVNSPFGTRLSLMPKDASQPYVFGPDTGVEW